jgi:Putative auto-transporter adhesin, head GIN domain
MRMLRLLSIAVLSATALASSGAAPTVIPVAQFRSVELHDGGNVIVRHGPTQRVTILMGDSRYTRIRVAGGQRLVIEKCQPDCPSDYQHRVEVITPEISAVSVSNGGTVQSVGAFPAQAAITAAVEQGGTVDIRSIPADAVDASVDSGGRIFTTPRMTLAATIVSGGGITYWGDPRVKRAVRDGGVVAKGTRADAGKPLSELNPPLAALPPIPPIAPIPPLRNDGS